MEKNEKTGMDEEVYKVEIPANRYDLLCVEGLTRALLIFQNKSITLCFLLEVHKKYIWSWLHPSVWVDRWIAKYNRKIRDEDRRNENKGIKLIWFGWKYGIKW